jgi:hypothetical protein
VATGPLRWDSTYGPELTGSQVTLKNFTFPFSGRRWTSFFVGASGSIRFGVSEKDIGTDPYGHRDAGIVLDRFDELARVAGTLADRAPAISVFLKPRLSGRRYVKELADRVIITWDLTEPFGSILDYTWFRTVNRFQAVLARDGSIRMSYAQLAAKDAIVGVYPILPGTSRAVATRFSAVSSRDGPFDAVYQAFHYRTPPRQPVRPETARSEETSEALGIRGRSRHHACCRITARAGDSNRGSRNPFTSARTKPRKCRRRARLRCRPLLLPCSLASCRIGHRPDSCCDTTTRSGISDTKWGTAGPRMSPRR